MIIRAALALSVLSAAACDSLSGQGASEEVIQTAVRSKVPAAKPGTVSLRTYLRLTSESPDEVRQALRKIEKGWQPGSAVMLVEAARFSASRPGFVEIIRSLEDQTGQRLGSDLIKWYKWIWSQNYQPHPQYGAFKSAIYSPIDRRFAEYFQKTDNATIRLDEIRWGGVQRDGIPPLKNPEMLPAKRATYLADTDVVFGVSLNGDTRCYPKRILAWHEMFKDTIGGEPVCGAY